MVNALPMELNYHDLIDKMVCCSGSKMCMLHQCSDCPGIDALNGYISEMCIKGISSETMVEYKQWVSTNQTILHTCTLPFCEFIDVLNSPPFYCQTPVTLFCYNEEQLKPGELIFLLDFAEKLQLCHPRRSSIVPLE